MSPSNLSQTQKIEAYRVSEHARMGTLPRHFGRHMMIVEDSVYDFLREFCAEYPGGYWHFYELSNGGFYMAPHMPSLAFCIPSNGFEGSMSADAAGITVCLFVFSHLSFRFPKEPMFSRHFQWLRDFALSHVESAQILAAID